MFEKSKHLSGRTLDGRTVNRLHVARKERRHDDWDPPIESYAVCESVQMKLSRRNRLRCG